MENLGLTSHDVFFILTYDPKTAATTITEDIFEVTHVRIKNLGERLTTVYAGNGMFYSILINLHHVLLLYDYY